MYVYGTLTVEMRKRNSDRKKQVEKEEKEAARVHCTCNKLCVHNVHVQCSCTYAYVHNIHVAVVFCVLVALIPMLSILPLTHA